MSGRTFEPFTIKGRGESSSSSCQKEKGEGGGGVKRSELLGTWAQRAAKGRSSSSILSEADLCQGWTKMTHLFAKSNGSFADDWSGSGNQILEERRASSHSFKKRD